MKYQVKYSPNNSGGSWWLKDQDWKALEQEGWVIDWYATREPTSYRPDPYPDGRWFDSLAAGALIETDDEPLIIIQAWEKTTNQDASAEGCNCCGEPHTFRVSVANPDKTDGWELVDHYSGQDIARLYYGDNAPTNYREALEQLKAQEARDL
jgi:hypothetical protein